MLFPRHAILVAAVFLAPAAALATEPKIDSETCNSLRLEQIKFRQSGILDDMNKGAEWAKANLPADRLREIEHYLQLDEQVRFGCRDAKLSPEAERASEAAARIEINSDADPTAPAANDPPKPGAADKKAAPKRAAKRKAKPSDSKTEGGKSAKAGRSKDSSADSSQMPPVVMQPQSAPATVENAQPAEASSFATAPSSQDPPLPAFGFGEMTVLPHSAP